MPGLFRLKLWICHVTSNYIKLQIYFSALSHTVFGTQRGSALPRNGSNFLDSVPHIRQLTSFWRMPPKMAVTTVDAPFLDKPHQRRSVSNKAWAEFPTPVPCLVLTPGTAAAQGHLTRVVATLIYLRCKRRVNLGGSKQMLRLSVLCCSWVHFYSGAVPDTHTGPGF